LNDPLPAWACVAGWIVATFIFFMLTSLLGGVIRVDAFETVFSTWAVAHGHMSCIYSPGNKPIYPYVEPLYPLLSGVAAALMQIGHGTAFPTQAQLGSHCSSAISAMTHWSAQSGAIGATLRIGYLSWFFLLGGAVSLLRAVGRGRCVWELLSVLVLACASSVILCLQEAFHPQDLIALGLALAGVASALRGKWVWAGLWLGLAFITQQFSLLALAPLFVLAPSTQRIKFASAVVGVVAVVIAPLVVLTSGRAIRAGLIGSGFSPSSEGGGTLLWETHVHGFFQFVLSRLMPIVCALVLAWWASRKLGPAALEPVALVSIIATSLTFRLVFEENLFGYYYMAIVVMLILLDVTRGRVRLGVVALLTTFFLWHDPVAWAFPYPHLLNIRHWIPAAVALVALGFFAYDVARRRFHPFFLAWIVFITFIFVRIPGDARSFPILLPLWLWQTLLVSSALALAVDPVVSLARRRREILG
jgi:hypothetical protein